MKPLECDLRGMSPSDVGIVFIVTRRVFSRDQHRVIRRQDMRDVAADRQLHQIQRVGLLVGMGVMLIGLFRKIEE